MLPVITTIFVAIYFFIVASFPSIPDYTYQVLFFHIAITLVYLIHSYYRNIWSKPLVSVKSIVKKKEKHGGWMVASPTYVVTFLLADKSELGLIVSELQYKLLEKGMVVDLVYQGTRAHSIKRATDKIPITYTEIFLKKQKK